MSSTLFFTWSAKALHGKEEITQLKHHLKEKKCLYLAVKKYTC